MAQVLRQFNSWSLYKDGVYPIYRPARNNREHFFNALAVTIAPRPYGTHSAHFHLALYAILGANEWQSVFYTLSTSPLPWGLQKGLVWWRK
jgi:hypothetical protein